MGAEAGGLTGVILATWAGAAGGALAEAAALAVAVARRSDGGVLVVEVSEEDRRRRPTLLASDPARELERAVRPVCPDARPAARGNVCWLRLTAGAGGMEDPLADLAALLDRPLPCALAVVQLPPALWAEALDREGLRVRGCLVRADLDADRELAALAVAELGRRGIAARVAKRGQGPVAARRSLAGLEAGGEATRRAERAAHVLADAPAPGSPGPRPRRGRGSRA